MRDADKAPRGPLRPSAWRAQATDYPALVRRRLVRQPAGGRPPNVVLIYADDMVPRRHRPVQRPREAPAGRSPARIFDRMAERGRTADQLLRRPGGVLGLARGAPHERRRQPREHQRRPEPATADYGLKL